MPPTLNQLLKSMVEQGGSDLHITTNSAPQIRSTVLGRQASPDDADRTNAFA
jgi:Tfp pilus assembly pilus retraction ATPase PilT